MNGAADGPGQPEIKLGERLTIRLHKDDNTLDEIVSYDEFGNCEFHMEQMDDNLFWMRWYSTKGRPLPKELIIHMGTVPATIDDPFRGKIEVQKFDCPMDFEPVDTVEYEKHIPEEYRTKPEDISKEVGHFVRYFGMKRLLEEMMAFTKVMEKEEKQSWPDRDTSYLDKLAGDLNEALKNYEDHYPGKPYPFEPGQDS